MLRKLEEYGIQVDWVHKGLAGLSSVVISPAEELGSNVVWNRRFTIEINNDFEMFITNKRIMFKGTNFGCAVHYDWVCYKIVKGEKIPAKLSDFERKWNNCFKTKMTIDQIADLCKELFLSYY